MYWAKIFTIAYFLVHTYNCEIINEFFDKVNKDAIIYNAAAAELAWQQSLNSTNPELAAKGANYQMKQLRWQHFVCDELASLKSAYMLNKTQQRQMYVFCRGPRFTFEEARQVSNLYKNLQTYYEYSQICIPRRLHTENLNLDTEISVTSYLENDQHDINRTVYNIAQKTKGILCLKGENDFEKLMSFSKKEHVLKWAWSIWRENMDPLIKDNYRALVEIENQAARRNGYTDIGAAWRDELEIPNLRQLCRHLYLEIKPYYAILHGVVRYYLRQHYGKIVPRNGPIPAHLLGNLWSQDWEPLIDIIIKKSMNLDNRIKHLNWTVEHMVKRAEDFYQSLGLPAMTDSFWRKSVFSRASNDTRCHGTAADMYRNGDYRLLYCSGTSMQDLYVIHHEMGLIQYYMAYQHQPGIFRQGANTALHETIGDTIMYGVMTPQHLHRLGLVNDTTLYDDSYRNEQIDSDNNNHDVNGKKQKIKSHFKNRSQKTNYAFDLNSVVTTDEILMLKLALNKLPQIPFALVIDEYRWKYFEGAIKETEYNSEFWRLSLELQGIKPPYKRGEAYFDVAAKYHVPDNTPYIRYFLSSFLQHQLFESLCKAAVFGRRNAKEDLPKTIPMNRCDIYGSKAAGKLLKDIMSRGSSQNWRDILSQTTGQHNISATALKAYYSPLFKLLMRLVVANKIPIGW